MKKPLEIFAQLLIIDTNIKRMNVYCEYLALKEPLPRATINQVELIAIENGCATNRLQKGCVVFLLKHCRIVIFIKDPFNDMLHEVISAFDKG